MTPSLKFNAGDDTERLKWLGEFGTEIYADETECELTYCLPDGDIRTVLCEEGDTLLNNIRGAIDDGMATQ